MQNFAKLKVVQLLLLVLSLFVTANFAQLDPTGMAKPIADLRDYNGTYEGSIGTGTKSYLGGTLYRDNQNSGATSGCVGEGCGRHPGVDIPVPTGTSVFASLTGVVAVSRCDPAWGGLVVIQSANPWNSGETIYFTYAHLSKRIYSNGQSVNVGDFVSTGSKIGNSGGNPKQDKCAGSSTGSHLHFQIDKDDGNYEPYFPSQSQLNYRDDNFLVTARTYNPLVFVVGGYRWTFAQTGNRELWDLFNLHDWGVAGGALWMDGSTDPYIRRGGLSNCSRSKPCSSNIAAEANLYQDVFLDLFNNCTDGLGQIFFTTKSDPNWNEDKSVYYASRFGAQQVNVWMGYNPLWKGVVTGIRIDPADQCSSNFDPTYYGEITIGR